MKKISICLLVIFTLIVASYANPSPRRLKRQAPVQCITTSNGSGWLKDCNWCKCVQGGAACTKKGCRPGWELRLDQQQKQCTGQIRWKNDCNWCDCVDEKAVCTKMSCEAEPRSLEAERERVCTQVGSEGGRWRNECNWCRCSQDGKGLCTRKGCPEAIMIHLRETQEPECEGNVHWKKNGVWHKCVAGKAEKCAKELCETPPPNPDFVDLFGVAKATCSPISDDGGWAQDCNWCRCIRGREQCTRRACNTNEGQTVVDPSLVRDTSLPSVKCNGRVRWKQDCNWCECVNGVGICSVNVCDPDVKEAVKKELACKTGPDGGSWKKDCNWCNCRVEFSTCTKKACPPGVLPVEPVCSGNIVWKKKDCNWCRCENGAAICTTRTCGGAGRRLEERTACEEGQTWVEGCNTCFCNGGRSLCTRRACLEDLSHSGVEPAALRSQASALADLDDSDVLKSADCVEGSRWKNDCNWCGCAGGGVAVCTLKGCLPDFERRSDEPLCEKGSQWKEECNVCSCLNALPVCTRKLCLTKDTESKPRARQGTKTSLIRAGVEPPKTEIVEKCTEGSRWGSNCNWCTCSNGVGICTLKGCLPGHENLLDGVCEGDSKWKQDCNSCSCENGKAVCTEKDCNSKGKEENQLCVNGNSWVEDCNICMCTKNVPVCTRRACLPQPRSAADSCEEGQSFKEDCNWCTCIEGLAACTRMRCLQPDESMQEVQTLPKLCSLSAINPNAKLCGGFEPKWTFNSENELCEEITYGGCGGTENLFNTEGECKTTCGRQKFVQARAETLDPKERCFLPQVAGPCFGSLTRYSFNAESKQCYGGCQGNQNSFLTLDECISFCGGHPPVIEGCDRRKCNWKRFAHYLAKDCRPVYKRGECCPTSFECKTEEERGLLPNVCYYNGHEYQPGQNVPVDSDCSVGCRCLGPRIPGIVAEITCANVECPSLFMRPKPGCREIFELGKCCSVSLDCNETHIEPRDSGCTWGGKHWKIGDKMDIDEEPCWTCVCTEDFSNPRGPGCKKFNCGYDFRYRSRLVRGHTPIFFEERCCSIDWIVPGDDRLGEVVLPENYVAAPFSEECVVGDLAVPVGASVTMSDCHIKCHCQTPPELTCVRYRSCELAEEVSGPQIRAEERGCGNVKCNWNRFSHYLAKDCKPVYKGGECCPTSFECKTEEERGLLPNICYYNGHEYQPGQNVPVDSDCSVRCRCNAPGIPGRVAEINCVNVECPSLFMRPKPGCREIFELGKCCSVSQECNTTHIEPRHSGCSWEGKTWKIGDKMFFEEEPCQTCVCTEDFTNPRGPGCKKLNCGYEFRYRYDLVRGNTPIFFENDCCPIDWIVPGDDRLGEVILPENYVAVPFSEECVAGDLAVPVGTSVTMSDCHIRCHCQTPPELTCVRYRSCELAALQIKDEGTGISCPAVDCPAGCSSKQDTKTGCPKCFCKNTKFICPEPICPTACRNPSVDFDESVGCHVCKCECWKDFRGEPPCPLDCKIRKFFDRESGCQKCECDQSVPQRPYFE